MIHRCRSVVVTFISIGVFLAARGEVIDSRLINVSVRARAGSGDATLIVGFVVQGSAPKSVLVRGVGPSLSEFNLPEVVEDPSLHLFSGNVQIAENDNWGGTEALATAFAETGAFSLAATSKDAALLRTVAPGAYTAHLRAKEGSGISLVECYDAAKDSPDSRFHNISARSVTGEGDDVLTVGFVIAGTGAKPVLVRGIGPSLARFGVSDAIAQAELRLFDAKGRGLIATRSRAAAAASSEVGAFSLLPVIGDSGFLLGLAPGAYTAQVRSVQGGPGTALIEVYAADAVTSSYVTLKPVSAPMPEMPFDPDHGTLSPGDDTPPRPIVQGKPEYPFDLRIAGVTGAALVGFYVTANGEVAHAVALDATDFRFAESAVAAVSGWQFTPARQDGRLITSTMEVPIIYSITLN